MRSVGAIPLLAVVFFLALLPTAEGGRDIENDPLMRFYKNRLAHAQAAVHRQEARLVYAKQRYERARKLAATNAISNEEYQRAAAWYELNLAKRDEVKAQVVEAESLLEICRNRMAEGKDMPILPLSVTTGEDLAG